MATEEILSDIGAIYRRLFHHRPVIQNEVQHFVKEFETKRGEDDLRSLQASMRMANEIDALFLEDMKAAAPNFSRIKDEVEEISDIANGILQEERSDLGTPAEEEERMAGEVEECRQRLQEEQDAFDQEISQEKERLKEEIRSVRENRNRIRTASLGSSVTLSVSSMSQPPPSPGGDLPSESTSEEEIVHS